MCKFSLLKRFSMTDKPKTGLLAVTSSDAPLTDFALIYPIMGFNSDRHLRCAEILPYNSEFSNAIAHLILSAEEQIKSLVCLLVARGFKLKQMPWFSKLFKEHKIRHMLVKDLFTIWLFIQGFLELASQKDKGFWKAILIYAEQAALGALKAHANYRWWEKADKLKQDCFYVDFGNPIIDPARYQYQDYHNALSHVTTFKREVRKIMAIIKRTNEKDLRELEKQMRIVNFEEMLSETMGFKKKDDKHVSKLPLEG